MPHFIRRPLAIRPPLAIGLPLLSALLLSSAALLGSATHASEPDTAAEQTWLDNTRAACEQQYGAAQCADPEFFEEHFHAGDLQTAHRAAIRRNDMERRALRELMLQRSCGNIAATCANGAADCAVQLQQMCTAIQREAASCVTQAAQYCTASEQNSNCLAQRQTFCPSVKKQTIDKLLAKYPKLTATQQAHIRQIALQMDAKDSSWIGTLFRWLGF